MNRRFIDLKSHLRKLCLVIKKVKNQEYEYLGKKLKD